MSLTSPWRKALLVVLALVIVFGSVPGPAGAQNVRSGGAVTVPSGTTETGDISVVGGTVVVEGTLDGSIDGFAGSVLVTGTVTGDVEVAAGSVTISGTVEGDVDAAAGAVTVTESGEVGGSLSAGAGSVAIAGTVGGDVRAGTDRLTVGPSARIGGTLRHDAGSLEIADGATITGGVERVRGLEVGVDLPFAGNFDFQGPLFPPVLFAVFGALASALLGALMLLAAPGFGRRVADTGTREPVRAAGAGLLTLVGIPVGLALLAVTIVGIPLTIAGTFVFFLFLWVAFVYGAVVTGTWLLTLADAESLWGALLAGLALTFVASFVPFVGDLVNLAYLLLGLGAFALSVLALRRGGESLFGGEGTEDERAEPTAD